jgi:hypothetical protein
MQETAALDDLAFIRRTLEDGRVYARARSPDMLIWGLAIAIGNFGTFGFVRRWWQLDPEWIWLGCIALPWLYTLRHFPRRWLGGAGARPRSPMTQATGALWLGCVFFLTTLGFGSDWFGAFHHALFGAVVAGVMGVGFYASASLCDLFWMRWVAACWWLGELLLIWLRDRPENLLVSAILMLFFLAGPGLALLLRGRDVP